VKLRVRWLRPTITREDALSIARTECESRGWPWHEPVAVLGHRLGCVGRWTVCTNRGSRGYNARISIHKKTGEVIKAVFLPR
jgi:hypothetical protein